jgi:hypothetical protein
MNTMAQIPGLQLVHDSLTIVSQGGFIPDAAAEDEREWLEIRMKHARSLYELLTEIDLRWRERVFDDPSRYNSSDEALLTHVSREMNSALHGLLALAEARERQGIAIAGTDEFRRIARDMAASLTPDDEFFAGESLNALEASAIAEHERGESKVMEHLDR